MDGDAMRIKLYLILFLHQTTTGSTDEVKTVTLYLILFLHQTTTENGYREYDYTLYLILFLHQTTTYGNLWIEKQRVTAVFNSQKYPYYRDEVNLMSLFPVSNVKELHFDSHESI